MRTNIRLRLDMGGRADEFCRANPDENPATALVSARLSDQVQRGKRLSELQRTSLVIVAAAVTRKNQLRESVGDHLTALAGISRAATATKPELTVHQRLPHGRTDEARFLSTARVAVAEATANKELFLKYAMPETLLETMTAELDEYEAAVSHQRNAVATQVGATAQLEAVAREIMGVVKHLDSLHRLRFRNDFQLLSAWKSARNVAWRQQEPADQTTPPLVEGTQAA